MTARPQHSWAAITDIGRVRTHNEDSVLGLPPLFVVADGLGGHQAGEVASSIAVETVRDHAPRRPDAKAIGRAVRAANREVMKASREGAGKQGMGTTMTAAVVEGTRIAIAHVGDSRAYLLHDGELSRITQDHSMVADMVRRGQITEAESRVHPNRSVITRALGSDANMETDTLEFTASPGDRLLLCSDGLHSMLEDWRIAEILGAYKDPEVTAKALVQHANDAGGHDNVSVVVVDIEDTGAPADDTTGKRGSARAVVAWLLAFVVVLAAVGAGVYSYARSQYFLIDEQGVVVVYRGVPGELAGRSLKWLITRTDTPVQLLQTGTQARLEDGITAGSYEEALKLADSFARVAAPSMPASSTGGY